MALLWQHLQSCQSTSVGQRGISLEKRKIFERFKDPIEIQTTNCHSPQRPLKRKQWMNTSVPNWAGADSAGTTPHIPAASPVSDGACGTLRGLGRGWQKVVSGLVNSWLGYKLRSSFSHILSVLTKKKKADFKFTLGFKIYYAFQSSSWVLCIPKTPFLESPFTSIKCPWQNDQQDRFFRLTRPESGWFLLLSSSSLSIFSSHLISLHPPFHFSSPIGLDIRPYSLFHCSKWIWKL